MKTIELVFRSIGDRTAQLAFGYALQQIRPQQAYLIENVTPPAQSVQKMLEYEYKADFVVFLDADCLIMEDLQPFLQANDRPFVDAYVWDRFRGWAHCGLHVKRRDVVAAMQQVRVPDQDLRHALRSESRIHNLALQQLGYGKAFKGFKILHDFGQAYQHIFAKYALRELRSRELEKSATLARAMQAWPDADEECWIARQAVAYARKTVPAEASALEIAEFIAALPAIAQRECQRLAIQEKPPLTLSEIRAFHAIPFGDIPGVTHEAAQKGVK